MAGGQTMPRPFLFRWLAPAILGPNPNVRWKPAARVSFLALCVLGGLYTWTWAGALIPLGLAGLTVQVRAPVLIDLHAMALALASATLAMHGWWIPSIFVAILAAFTKETAPIFAAAWAWSPWPLLAFAAVAARAMTKPGEDVCGGVAHDALTHPLKTAWAAHKSQPLAWWTLPLGVLLIGACSPTLQVAVVLVLAYGQCILATDLVRLYTWAWPALALRTFDLIPSRWWPLACVLHIANPTKGEGW
jgi:hypothetical protein